jgi:hypothetical protein
MTQSEGIEYKENLCEFYGEMPATPGSINYVDQYNVVEPRNSYENLEDSNDVRCMGSWLFINVARSYIPFTDLKLFLCINKSQHKRITA